MVSNGASSLDELLDDGWDYHDKESEHLARELEAAAAEGVAPELLGPFSISPRTRLESIWAIGRGRSNWESAF